LAIIKNEREHIAKIPHHNHPLSRAIMQKTCVVKICF